MSTTERGLRHDRWLQVPSTWNAYLLLQKARGEAATPRYTFYKGRLTIVSPSNTHELLKKRLGFLIESIFTGLDIPFSAHGMVTLLKSVPLRTGTEGDECYYLRNLDAVQVKKDLVMGVDPSPDLMIKVVISHPVTDALSVYRELGVPEVWICKASEIVFLVRDENGRYRSSAISACLPILSIADLTPWVFRHAVPNEPSFRRAFARWVEDELIPRYERFKAEGAL